MKLDKRNNKPVAFQKHTIAEEDLPFPIVYYPNFYGTFFAFKRSRSEKQFYLCSCTLLPLKNYLRFRLEYGITQNAHSDRMFVLDSFHFPQSFIDELMHRNIEPKKIIQEIQFVEGLCHECNNATPSYRWCIEMYGGVFKQNFGWYIKKQAYEWGVTERSDWVLRDVCPGEILELLTIQPPSFPRDEDDPLYDHKYEEAFAQSKDYHKQMRIVWNAIESEARRKFGFKPVGESWTGETTLYRIIQRLFPEYEITRNFKPAFLNGLEIDIWIEELRIGIEYQGIQHFKPVEHWGGENALSALQDRDKAKSILCKDAGVSLYYFNYNDQLSEDSVRSRFAKFLK